MPVSHCPFKAESELLDGFDTAKDAFYAYRNQLQPLQKSTDVEISAVWETEV